MAYLGWVVSVDGIIQAYGNTGLPLKYFFNGVTHFSPSLTGPLARGAVVAFDLDGPQAVNVTPTGDREPNTPKLSYTSDKL
jgi:hypothetical protein